MTSLWAYLSWFLLTQVLIAASSIFFLFFLSSSHGFVGIWIALSIFMSLRALAGFLRYVIGWSLYIFYFTYGYSFDATFKKKNLSWTWPSLAVSSGSRNSGEHEQIQVSTDERPSSSRPNAGIKIFKLGKFMTKCSITLFMLLNRSSTTSLSKI